MRPDTKQTPTAPSGFAVLRAFFRIENPRAIAIFDSAASAIRRKMVQMVSYIMPAVAACHISSAYVCLVQVTGCALHFLSLLVPQGAEVSRVAAAVRQAC
jgi:hypothetical protein